MALFRDASPSSAVRGLRALRIFIRAQLLGGGGVPDVAQEATAFQFGLGIRHSSR